MLLPIRTTNNIPTVDKAILLGPWCLSSADDVDKVQILESPWTTKSEFRALYNDVYSLYKQLLKFVSKAMNETHLVHNDIKFWEILLGPFLYHFISCCYCKYFRLLKAKDLNIFPLMLPSKKYNKDIVSTVDFVINVNHNDFFNLDIISEVATYLHYPISYSDELFEHKNSPSTSSRTQKHSPSYKNILAYKFQRYFFSAHSAVHYNALTSAKYGFILFLLSKFKIIDLEYFLKDEPIGDLYLDQRKSFKANMEKNTKNLGIRHPLLELLMSLVTKYMPQSFLEHWPAHIERHKSINTTPKTIMSSIGWYYHEFFKFWAATCKSKGSKLIGMQHGGGYGIRNCFFHETHERNITDKYISWGWDDKKGKEVLKLPAQKLVPIQQVAYVNKKPLNKILYITTAGSRFTIQMPDIPENSLKYFQQQDVFLSSLDKDIMSKIQIRLHPEDKYCWNNFDRLKSKYKEIAFNLTKENFLDSLLSSDLIITDHFSTTFLEALTFNKPIIIFFDIKEGIFRKSALLDFHKMRKIQIFHSTAESAAKFLNTNLNKIEDLWYSPTCQELLNNFRKKHALKTSDTYKHYIKGILDT
jgi:putative transferase (TIGR04331 family)